MADRLLDTTPLPANFPQDFLPDRLLLARLMNFAVGSGGGTKIEIGAETGIPTGKSTGKVEPMIHYGRGMGLIAASRMRGRWELGLTALGGLVHAQDPYLDEPVTLWALHLLLCRRTGSSSPARGVADPWFALFAEGGVRLGTPLERASYLAFLTERHGRKGYLRSLSGLVPRTYTEATCLGPIGVLSQVGRDAYRRNAAPDERAYFPAYTVALFLGWDGLYPEQRQVSLDDLYRASRLLEVLGWDRVRSERWLAWMANRGLLQLDRLTGGTMALRLRDTGAVVRGLYDELT